VTNAGQLISGRSFDVKMEIGCNIRRLPQFVNVSFSTKADQRGGLSCNKGKKGLDARRRFI
jgi:hypothetical protein